MQPLPFTSPIRAQAFVHHESNPAASYVIELIINAEGTVTSWRRLERSSGDVK